jgi:hypothetical protein
MSMAQVEGERPARSPRVSIKLTLSTCSVPGLQNSVVSSKVSRRFGVGSGNGGVPRGGHLKPLRLAAICGAQKTLSGNAEARFDWQSLPRGLNQATIELLLSTSSPRPYLLRCPLDLLEFWMKWAPLSLLHRKQIGYSTL